MHLPSLTAEEILACGWAEVESPGVFFAFAAEEDEVCEVGCFVFWRFFAEEAARGGGEDGEGCADYGGGEGEVQVAGVVLGVGVSVSGCLVGYKGLGGVL